MRRRALIVDAPVPVATALRVHLEGLGLEARIAVSGGRPMDQLPGSNADLLFACVTPYLDAAALCRSAREAAPRTAVILVYPPEQEDADAHAAAAGADSFIAGPLKRAPVAACVRASLQILELRETVQRLQARAGPHPRGSAAWAAEAATPRPSPMATAPLPPPAPEAAPSSANSDMDFFKKYLSMEVKRSRRHRYPVAFLLAGIDRFKERASPLAPELRASALDEALEVVTGAVREIDVSASLGDGRLMLFLPHTTRDGALRVAGRVRDGLAQRLSSLPGATISVGVAAYEPGAPVRQVSFGSLMKDASEALRRAQAAGGNAVHALQSSP